MAYTACEMAVYTFDFVKYFKFTSNGTQLSVVATQLRDRIVLGGVYK